MKTTLILAALYIRLTSLINSILILPEKLVIYIIAKDKIVDLTVGFTGLKIK